MENSLLPKRFSPENLMSAQKGSLPILMGLGVCLGFLVSFPDYLNYDVGEIKNTVSLFGGTLKGIGSSRLISIGLALSFLLFTGSYLHGKLQRFFAAIAPLLFIGSLSIHYENQSGFDHTLILPSQFFILICLYHFFWQPNYQIKHLNETKYPTWLKVLPAIFLGIHYFGSGFTKVMESGLQWADGVSLMTWVTLWSNPNSFPASLLIDSFYGSLIAQVAILCIEVLCVFFFFNLPKINFILGLALICFHILNEFLFQYGFWVNIFFLWIVFIHPVIGKTLAKNHLSRS